MFLEMQNKHKEKMKIMIKWFNMKLWTWVTYERKTLWLWLVDTDLLHLVVTWLRFLKKSKHLNAIFFWWKAITVIY